MYRPGSFLPEYLSTRTMAGFLAALLLCSAGLFSISAGFEVSEVRLLVSAHDDGSISAVDRFSHSLLRHYLAIGRLATVGATAVLFIVWLFRCRVNARAFGARRFEFSRRWVVLAFAIPIVNLIRPLQVVSEVWRASDPRAARNPFDWKVVPVPSFVSGWWWMLVGVAALELLAMAMVTSTGVTLQRMTLARGLSALADLGAAVTAVLAHLVVNGIARAQDDKWAVLRGLMVPPATDANRDAIGDPVIASML